MPAARVPALSVFMLAGAALVISALATPASAQARGSSFPRLEVGGGGGAAGGVSFGDRDANLLTNSTSGAPFRLFATSTELRPAVALEVRLGYRVTPRLAAEGRLTFARPSLVVSISQDAEDASPVEATSRLTEYVVEGGASWRLSVDARRQWIPFVSGGAGLARHVHDGRALAENGVAAYAGAGALYGLGTPRGLAPRRTGLRFDVRLQVLSGGVAEGAGASPRVVATAGAFVAF